MQRYGSVIGVHSGKIEEYKKLHAAAWPAVLRKIHECNLRNFSIYLRTLENGRSFLFSYYEYAGSDYAADMAKIAADPITCQWWSFCEPCQKPLPDRQPGEWWSPMQEVFHCD